MKNRIGDIKKILNKLNQVFPPKTEGVEHNFFALYTKERNDWSICVVDYWLLRSKKFQGWLKILQKQFNITLKTEHYHTVTEKIIKNYKQDRYIYVC